MEDEGSGDPQIVMHDYLLAWFQNPDNSSKVKQEFIKRYRVFSDAVKEQKPKEEIQKAEKQFNDFAAECGFQNIDIDLNVMEQIRDLSREARDLNRQSFLHDGKNSES